MRIWDAESYQSYECDKCIVTNSSLKYWKARLVFHLGKRLTFRDAEYFDSCIGSPAFGRSQM